MNDLSSYQFKPLYKELGIDITKLYCVMLDTKTDGIEMPEIPEDYLYTSPDPKKSWIKGYVAKDGMHCTLLFGLLDNVTKDMVETVLKGWEVPKLQITNISKFDSKDGEDYYCVIGEIDITPELTEGHDRLEFLPHVNTFPGYKAHITLAYIKKDQDMLDEVIKEFSDKLTGIKGESLKVDEITFDNNSGNKQIIKV